MRDRPSWSCSDPAHRIARMQSDRWMRPHTVTTLTGLTFVAHGRVRSRLNGRPGMGPGHHREFMTDLARRAPRRPRLIATRTPIRSSSAACKRILRRSEPLPFARGPAVLAPPRAPLSFSHGLSHSV